MSETLNKKKRFTCVVDEYGIADVIGVDTAKLYKDLDDKERVALTFALIKLAELEDIEEELGIDLITLLKALMEGIYVVDDGEILEETISGIERFNDGWGFSTYYNDFELTLSEYGKYWALTEEELEEI